MITRKSIIYALMAALTIGLFATLYRLEAFGQIQDATEFTGIRVQATALATATPALHINSSSVSNLVEVQDNATPVFQMYDGGGAALIAPTAIATGVPALTIRQNGVSVPFEVRNANATPVFQIGSDGSTSGGLTLDYASAGRNLYCATNTITGSAGYTSSTHALATPEFAWCDLAESITGESYNCNTVNSSGVITVEVFTNQATPAASGAGASVTWCAIGTP